MKANRFWVEIAAIGAGIACALALLIAMVGAAAVAVAGQTLHAKDSAPKTYQGMVTCSRCGAKHSAASGKTASGCALVCVHGGSTFTLVDGEKVYLLDGDVNILKKVAGERAEIQGVAHGNTITVSSITAVAI